MTPRRPDFLVIGAMKCATTTLDAQLARQDGFFMAEKELGYFAVDETFARGSDWYFGKFAAAPAGAIAGESSTDYAKGPDYPETAARIRAVLPDVKLVYVIRHPLSRLVSHYIHDWTERRISVPIDQAVDLHPALVNYGRYAMQLTPYLEHFAPERIHLIFFERLTRDLGGELLRLGRFLGAPSPLRPVEEAAHANESSQRLRKSPLRDALVWNPVSTFLRRALVPRRIRDAVKAKWRMNVRPELSPEVAARLTAIFDADLAGLTPLLGRPITVGTWNEVALADLAPAEEAAR